MSMLQIAKVAQSEKLSKLQWGRKSLTIFDDFYAIMLSANDLTIKLKFDYLF